MQLVWEKYAVNFAKCPSQGETYRHKALDELCTSEKRVWFDHLAIDSDKCRPNVCFEGRFFYG